jgi:hypothetical protein
MTGSEKQFLDAIIEGITQDKVGELASVLETDTNEAENIQTRPFTKGNFLVHHDTHPLTLYILLTSTYGTDWVEWEPETIWEELMDDFKSTSISEHVKSKIQAVKTISVTEWPFTKWEIFCPIVQALNNNIPDFEVMRKPTPSQLMVAVDIMTMIRNDVEFSQEIQQFCAASMLDAGIYYAPQPIAFCQDEIEDYLKFQDIPYDIEAVKEKFQTVKSLPPAEIRLEETVVDIQVVKLLDAYDYLDMRRKQLKHQLEVVR